MEKELTELFESVKKAADAADNSPGEEDRCLDALKRLKKYPVNYQVLVSTQVGKRLRQLTKHRSDKIKALASNVVEIWKSIIIKETMNNKKTGAANNGASTKSEFSGPETSEAKTIQRSDSIKSDHNSANKKLNPDTSSSIKIEKAEATTQMKTNASGGNMQAASKVSSSGARKPASDPVGPPKLSSMVYCKDPLRDKVREILAEALCKVSSEVDAEDDHLKLQVDECDPNRVAVLVETAMFEKWGKSNGAQKFKYRSIMFNIKDQNNPDFRRKVLVGEFEPKAVPDLTPEQMASDARQNENEKLKQKALFNSERAAAPKASTNEFTCGRCKKKETTYYQMQTRSADEPMTTFVTCVNCGNHWKFC